MTRECPNCDGRLTAGTAQWDGRPLGPSVDLWIPWDGGVFGVLLCSPG